MHRMGLAAIGLGCFMASSAAAHGVDWKKEARELGHAVGHAYACLPDDADARALARAESESLYDLILFGLDHEIAYLYAVSVGFGAAADKAKIDCDAITSDLAELKKKMGFGGTK